MKTPDLTYNEYFPFYTQQSYGTWKYRKEITSVIHLSEKKGLLIKVAYERKKIKEIKLELVSGFKELIERKRNYDYISYPQLSKELNIFITHLHRSLRILTSKPAYIVDTYGLISYRKWNKSVKVKFRKYSDVVIEYGDFDDVIIEGKKVSEQSQELHQHIEETELSPLLALGKALDNGTSYKEYENEKFMEDLSFYLRGWIYPYFEAPKFIRKKEYKL